MPKVIVQKKRLNINQKDDIAASVAFGWKVTGTFQYRNGRYIVKQKMLERKSSVEHFDELCELEKQYADLQRQIWKPKPVDPSIAVLLFLLLIVPMIIYLAARLIHRIRMKQRNKKLRGQMQDLVRRGQELQGIVPGSEDKTKEEPAIGSETVAEDQTAEETVPENSARPDSDSENRDAAEATDTAGQENPATEEQTAGTDPAAEIPGPAPDVHEPEENQPSDN